MSIVTEKIQKNFVGWRDVKALCTATAAGPNPVSSNRVWLIKCNLERGKNWKKCTHGQMDNINVDLKLLCRSAQHV